MNYRVKYNDTNDTRKTQAWHDVKATSFEDAVFKAIPQDCFAMQLWSYGAGIKVLVVKGLRYSEYVLERNDQDLRGMKGFKMNTDIKCIECQKPMTLKKSLTTFYCDKKCKESHHIRRNVPLDYKAYPIK